MNSTEKLDLIKHPAQYPTFGDTRYPTSWQGAFFAAWWEFKTIGLHPHWGGKRIELPSLSERLRGADAALIEEAARLYASPQSEGRRNVFRRTGQSVNAYIYTDDEAAIAPSCYTDLLRWLASWDTQAAREAPYTAFFHCMVGQASDELAGIRRQQSGEAAAADYLQARALGEVQTINDV